MKNKCDRIIQKQKIIFTIMRKNCAFTLLELIIVIIIVGVLATFAMPRFVRLIEVSRATEAIRTLTSIRNAVETCYVMNNESYLPCVTDWSYYIDDPSSTPNAHFVYTFVFATEAGYFFTAQRNDFELSMDDPGSSISCLGQVRDPNHSQIALCKPVSGEVSMHGGGLYSSIKFNW